jgi:hypothetical protein
MFFFSVESLSERPARYLRESLSGNSRTTMLATCSPVALNYEESASTLR